MPKDKPAKYKGVKYTVYSAREGPMRPHGKKSAARVRGTMKGIDHQHRHAATMQMGAFSFDGPSTPAQPVTRKKNKKKQSQPKSLASQALKVAASSLHPKSLARARKGLTHEQKEHKILKVD